MRKIVIWGMGADYERIHSQLRFECLKGNIDIIALVARKEDIYMSMLDGISVITKDKLVNYKFDYLVIASREYFNEILEEVLQLHVDRDRVINGMVFLTSNFDFRRYVKLIENPITIISDDCWGGIISKNLYLPANTPTINTLFEASDFLKFIADLPYYMNESIHMLQEGDIRKNRYPVGLIGEGDKQIAINFAHERSFEEGVSKWERRKKRFNYDNVFVKMGINGHEENAEQMLEKFEQIPYKKVCFYSGETSMKTACYLKRFEVQYIIGKNRDLIQNYRFDTYCRNYEQLIKSVDVLKLLSGENDYMREWGYKTEKME